MNQKGFSLVELKVCCAIIVILAGIACPMLKGMPQSDVLRNEIKVLYSGLQHAKMTAIKENAFVVFTTTDKGYQIFVDDGNGSGKSGDWHRQPHEKQLMQRDYADGVALEKCTFWGGRVRFNGRMSLVGGRVILKNNEGAKTQIVVSNLGRLRIEKI